MAGASISRIRCRQINAKIAAIQSRGTRPTGLEVLHEGEIARLKVCSCSAELTHVGLHIPPTSMLQRMCDRHSRTSSRMPKALGKHTIAIVVVV